MGKPCINNRANSPPVLELYDGDICVKTFPIETNIVCKTGKYENNICKAPDVAFYQEPFFIALIGAVVGAFFTFGVNVLVHNKTKPKARISNEAAYLDPASKRFVLIKLKNNGEKSLNINAITLLHKEGKGKGVEENVNLLLDPIESIDEVKMPFPLNSNIQIESKTIACFALFSESSFSKEKLKVLIETGDTDITIDVTLKSDFMPSLNQIKNVKKLPA